MTAEVSKRAFGDDLWIYRFSPPDFDPQRARWPRRQGSATAEGFAASLKAAGVRSELWTSEGQPHGFFNESKSQRRFLDTLLTMGDFLVSPGWLSGQADRRALRGLARRPFDPPLPEDAASVVWSRASPPA